MVIQWTLNTYLLFLQVFDWVYTESFSQKLHIIAEHRIEALHVRERMLSRHTVGLPTAFL